MEAAFAFLMGVVFLTLIGGALWWAHMHTQERRRVWSQIAARRGGLFREPQWGVLKSTSEAIEVTVGHAIVRLDLYVVSTGKSSTTYTRARARYAVGAGPTFQVYEEGFFSSIGKALGTQDLEIGDRGFDEIFMVKGDDLDALRSAWTPRARAFMRDTLRQTRAEADGYEVKLVVHGALTDPAVIDAMLELAGELASYGARALDELAGLPHAALVPVAGTWDGPVPPSVRIATERGEVQASIRPGARSSRLLLSLASDRELPAFSVDVAEGRADGMPPGVLGEAAIALLPAADGGTLTSDGAGRLQLSWSRIPPTETVGRAVKLLGELAGGPRSVGAFR